MLLAMICFVFGCAAAKTQKVEEPLMLKIATKIAQEIEKSYIKDKHGPMIVGYFTELNGYEQNHLCTQLESSLRNVLKCPQKIDFDAYIRLQKYWKMVKKDSFDPGHAIKGLLEDAHCLVSAQLILYKNEKVISALIFGHDTQTGTQLLSANATIDYSDPDIKDAWENKIVKPEPEKKIVSNLEPLEIKMWTDTDVYYSNEQIILFVKGNKDFFGRIYNISPSGDQIKLLPNKYRKIKQFKGNVTYKIPDKQQGDMFSLKAKAPFGLERIIILASEQQFNDVSMETIQQGLQKYRGTEKSLTSKHRAINVVPDFYKVSCEVMTRER